MLHLHNARKQIVALAAPPPSAMPADSSSKKPRSRHLWADLLRRIFLIDVLTCPCGQPRKIIGCLTRAQQPDPLAAILRSLGEPTEPPVTMPARAPPQQRFDFGGDVDFVQPSPVADFA